MEGKRKGAAAPFLNFLYEVRYVRTIFYAVWSDFSRVLLQ